ncbi:MAG: VWA domain-containing protein [Candidatus Thermoplasmatota archaeon]|nr:VWA domain-containing protein [Candidatus Thermoplasmatota archaeon]
MELEHDADIPYPHIRAAGVIIPDCTRGVYHPFMLTSREKRDLIKNIATRGLKGIDKFMENPQTSGAVADRMDEIRKKIDRQLEQVRATRRENLDRQIRRLTEKASIMGEEAQDGLLQGDGTFRRFSSEQIRGEILASELVSVLEGRSAPRDYVKKECIFKKIWKAIRSFLIKIASLLCTALKFLGSLFKKKKKIEPADGPKKRGAISLPFPVLESELSRWEEEIEKKLNDDGNLQKAVNRRLSEQYGYDEGYIQLKSSYDKDWYVENAKNILRKEVENIARTKEKELGGLKEKRKDSQAEAKEKERLLRERAMKLEKEFEEEVREGARKLEDLTKTEMKKELISSLSFMGYLEKRDNMNMIEDAENQWEITEALVEKFSEFVFSELMEKEGGIKDRRGRHISDAGVYEKARIRMLGEEARMDILQTIVNSRMNHPGNRHIETSDIIVNREVTTSELHAVILVDVSGSMEENMRLEAAKRSVLALSQAIKRENPRNKVDIVKVSTRASPVSLKDVLGLEPRGFTNHQEALSIARKVLEGSRSERNLLFLITDGLPEAYIDEQGRAVAGDLETAMELTLKEASSLNRIENLTFQVFLLEPEDEIFTGAARKMARAGYGDVIVADPKELAYKVIGEYLSTAKGLEGV